MSFRRDALASKLPVSLITGFLGSGKTTLISKLVRHPDMNRVAVIINEIGEIGIDHDLVSMSSESVSLLSNGCLCCALRTDLQETLRLLFAQRRVGEIPDFDRVVVETTGLADPAPILQTLVSDALLATQYRPDGTVTLVDAVNGAAQIEQHAEATRQIALADRILISKTDLASPDAVASLERRIAGINRQASIVHIVNGQIDPASICGLGLASSLAGPATLRFLGERDEDSGTGDGPYLGKQLTPLHDPEISTLSLRFDKPFTWSVFTSAMSLLTSMRGPDLLRVKGIVNVDGAPVLVQAVQHIFHEPVSLDRWPSEDTGSRIVFITRNIDADAIRSLFTAVTALGEGGVKP
ncbi:CobW family GTP-binding protein [Pararobbsia alpina]|uniref:P-loop guanosine triphosphatase YjiA n=1 Tax=Pararobbsia alpina TaxID=621374 RepID=A0A6S7BFI0_9BURK|nr:GTP-binding protein [Pararobbsia alpina]CAB3797855.1 P-loop guanosine triphosphatase YjiA [Pararobbsia alpina]